MFGFQYFNEKRKKGVDRRGFLMMYAILFITVVLSISIEILNLSLKQLIVSSTGEESARALSAADAGVECALYLDLYKGYFSSSTPTTTYTNICGANDITIIKPNDDTYNLPPVFQFVWQNPPNSLTSFQVKFDTGENLICANVYVIKNLFTTGINKYAIKNTVVKSYGYNTDCPPDPPQRLPLVERRIITSY